MFAAMLDQAAPLDRVFRALADPTRLAVVQRLGRGTASATELAKPFDMALSSFLQHLKVLEGCGLIHSAKKGRVRSYQLAPEPLRAAEGWLAEQRALWDVRLNQLDSYLESLKSTTGDEKEQQ